MSNINYARVNWKDYPDTDTPVNGTNLNKMDKAISDIVTNMNANGNTFDFAYDNTSQRYGYNIGGTFNPFKTAHTGTYTPTSRSASLDMGEDHTYRYVNTNSVPNSNSGTFGIVTSNGTHDMGATNNYRYVSVNVPISAVSGPIQAVYDGVDRSYSSWITVSSWSKYRGFAVCAYAGNGVGGVSWGTIDSNGTVTYSSKSQYTDVEVSGNKIRGHQSIMSNVGVFLIVF